jgi:hypothetical protein
VLRFIPLLLLAGGTLCTLAGLALASSRLKAKLRLSGSLGLGIGFCLFSISATLPRSEPEWHRFVVGGIGVAAIYGGLVKFRRDPLAKRAAPFI